MYFVCKFLLVFLTISALGLSQVTVADESAPTENENPKPPENLPCPGGVSERFKLSGKVDKPAIYTLKKLQKFPSSRETVSFQTKQGLETHTYIGVPLWTLIDQAGLQPSPDPTVKNSFLRKYIVVSATDCYKVVLSEGEIDPNFEAKQVLVAYATQDDPNQDPQLLGDQGIARLVVPGDKAGGRYVSNITRIQVGSAPD